LKKQRKINRHKKRFSVFCFVSSKYYAYNDKKSLVQQAAEGAGNGCMMRKEVIVWYGYILQWVALLIAGKIAEKQRIS
jgi:hypothetical protein